MDRNGMGDETGLEAPEDIEKGLKHSEKNSAFSKRSGIVTAKGTADGLVLRLDSRSEQSTLLKALVDFISSRKSFLEGNAVDLEWIGGEPEEGLLAAVEENLVDSFNITVRSSKVSLGIRSMQSGAKVMRLADRVEYEQEGLKPGNDSAGLGLFGGIEGLELSAGMDIDSSKQKNEVKRSLGNPSVDEEAWDDPNARLVYRTLRSGQKIETEHSLIIVGDVNSGAELVAGGDIIVLGSLRGVAHAGAYDETGGGRFIMAIDLQPTQLRIGSIISRGGIDEKKGARAEIARVDGNLIVVEPYQTRSISGLRR